MDTMPTHEPERSVVAQPRRPKARRVPIVAASVVEAPAAESGAGAVLSARGTAIDTRSLLFDPDWYLQSYPDVANAGLDPVRHYFENGAREGRNPNRFFDTHAYVRNHPDVAAASMNPFMHYLLYGAREGRNPA